jgi:hypothetical protein
MDDWVTGAPIPTEFSRCSSGFGVSVPASGPKRGRRRQPQCLTPIVARAQLIADRSNDCTGASSSTPLGFRRGGHAPPLPARVGGLIHPHPSARRSLGKTAQRVRGNADTHGRRYSPAIGQRAWNAAIRLSLGHRRKHQCEAERQNQQSQICFLQWGKIENYSNLMQRTIEIRASDG